MTRPTDRGVASAESDGAALVPTGKGSASYACVRSLGRRGVDVIIGGQEREPASFSRYCTERVALPPPEQDLLAYRDALLEVAARHSVRTIVPIRPYDAYVLSKYRERFERDIDLPVPSIEALRRVYDRVALYEAACEADVPVPETRLLEDRTVLDGESIVKSRFNLVVDEYVSDCRPGESHLVKTVNHVRPGPVPNASTLTQEMYHRPIVQEFVHHTDMYVFGALYDHGEALATFQHRQVRGNSYTGGGGVYRKSVFDPELERVGQALLDHLDWHGLACIEYMRDDETGEFVLTEVNPRMWQSLPTAVRAGADFPYYYWLQATGHPLTDDPTYAVNVGTHLLSGEVFHLASILTDDSDILERPSLLGVALAIARSCVSDPHFDVLHLDDPLPFARGALDLLR